MLDPDNTITQPIPRVPATAPIDVTRLSGEPLPAHLSPRGLPADEVESPYVGNPPPLFGKIARAVLTAVACTLIVSAVLTAFQLGQLSVPTMPFAGDPPQQGTTSAAPSPSTSAKPTRAPVVKTTPQPTQVVTPDEKDDVVIVVDKPVATPKAPPETTPTSPPSAPTPSSEPSTPATTAPATTQPPTSTPPVPSDQPTASAPAPDDLESTPPTE